MNFDKIFFRLLIIKTLYQCSLSQFIEIAPLSEITVLNDRWKKYTNAVIAQHEDGSDRFRISDPNNPTLYSHYFRDDFSSKMIEFGFLYIITMEILYRRADNHIVWLKCVFPERQFTQAFFRKIYSNQEKGDGVLIFRIARYFEATRQIEPYVKHATMYSKDMREFTNGVVKKTYFITHFNETNSSMEIEADFIFPSRNFAISDIYENNKIALCINIIADQRILISFSDPIAGQRFLTTHMPEAMQRDNLILPCRFPQHLSPEQVFDNLDSF